MSVKDKTLKVLENNKGNYISGSEIARELSVSRNAIWKAVKSLQNEDYNIYSGTNKGYCLSNDTDILSNHSIYKYLTDNSNFDITVHKTIDSTNNEVKEVALNSGKEGIVVISEEQTEGRGRFGRKFYSPSKSGIYMSILLRPKIHTSKAFLITTAAAVAVCEAIEAHSNKQAKIKWVNDIYCDNKKVCGILTEAAFDFESGMLDYAVLGIGINVLTPKEGFKEEIKGIATGIFDDTALIPIDIRSKIIAKTLEIFWEYYKQIEDKSFLHSYKERSLLVGKEVNIFSNKNSERAIVLGIDDECKLKVEMDDGTIKYLSSGEVSIKL